MQFLLYVTLFVIFDILFGFLHPVWLSKWAKVFMWGMSQLSLLHWASDDFWHRAVSWDILSEWSAFEGCRSTPEYVYKKINSSTFNSKICLILAYP